MNLARFDLVSIQVAVFCAQHGSLGAAAKAAYMSKSRASDRVASLEASLGQTLFIRDHKRLHLTQAGILFVERSRQILNEVQILHRQLSSMESSAVTLAAIKHGSKKRRTALADAP